MQFREVRIEVCRRSIFFLLDFELSIGSSFLLSDYECNVFWLSSSEGGFSTVLYCRLVLLSFSPISRLRFRFCRNCAARNGGRQRPEGGEGGGGEKQEGA